MMYLSDEKTRLEQEKMVLQLEEYIVRCEDMKTYLKKEIVIAEQIINTHKKNLGLKAKDVVNYKK